MLFRSIVSDKKIKTGKESEKTKINDDKKSPLLRKKPVSEIGRRKSKDVDLKIKEESVKKVKVENNLGDIIKTDEDVNNQLKRCSSDPILKMNNV